MQDCVYCLVKNPNKALFCMMCGRKLKPKKGNWKGELLEIDPKADFSLYNCEILGFNGQQPDSREVIGWLGKLIPSQRQVHIRIYGLDGNGRRTIGEIAQEVGTHPALIRDALQNGKVRLRRHR